ncbi:putative FAD-linked oxidoreductase [Rubellimicrobium mesophilum DSM 19309]|uniref:Putative FAD-linked oxidoreductase n=1 Tax=Rubellimicrobium mesophilum DSM 19309 TaxID=442562 RepID=A0A017HNE0_9RHOB|nr:FAD-dependent oxidoreductase [Rubellimicrobium mesophilum]EYD75987.1 putative FAD-linked oxidoreductase [Rubellimicrobium mesophilum DSM 19309]
MRREVLVLGGGLAGAAAAVHLARAGRDVCLIERTPGPHDKVCGEFLSFEAQGELRRIGVEPRMLGAVPIQAVAVEAGRRRAEAPLGFEALSLSRRVLDEALLAKAAETGAEVRRGARVTGLVRDGEGWSVEVEGQGRIGARHVVLATGKHDLRGWRRPDGRQSDLIGFKAYWHLPNAAEGTVELHLFPGGYAGLEMVEGGLANLCLVVGRAGFDGLGRRWERLLSHVLRSCPGLRVRLAGAEPCEGRPLAIGRIPYGFVQEGSDGLWRVGDQAAVIPSFTGEGMSIALHSARLASSFLLAGRGAEAFQRRLARDVRGQVRLSTLISQALVAPGAQAAAGWLLVPPVLRWALWRTRLPETARRRV